jgi:hypothetical protein
VFFSFIETVSFLRFTISLPSGLQFLHVFKHRSYTLQLLSQKKHEIENTFRNVFYTIENGLAVNQREGPERSTASKKNALITLIWL